MSKRTAGLNQLGPPPRVPTQTDGYLIHRQPWVKRRQRLEAERFARWRAAHPEWQPSPEQVQRREEMVKRQIVRTAVGNALARGCAVTTSHVRKVTLPKLKCLEQEP